ncbi:CoF synthetase [Allomuricauda taeanensis]|uniref:CoF synthetase n=1 Tax=Flagellimonas taeanensis TaxID=1005926 RepID=UPI002E7B8BEA|nr:CoF synthetase [Allomuricauda taeanensis]MEE1963227.1 CoF synthetase [Allomuricauda taeanensis]
MKLMTLLRRNVFWGLDFLKGSPIRNHYKEIKKLLEPPFTDENAKIRNDNLERLLRHSTATTPFYAKYRDFQSLKDFPVIDKNRILGNYEDFKSMRYKDSKLYKVSSSGSTGVPFGVFQDKNKKNRNTADVIYFSERAGGVFGDKFVIIKLWDHKNRKGSLLSFMQNIYAYNVTDTLPKDMDRLISDLERDMSPKNILGYPSFFEELCNHLDQLTQQPKIKGVNTVISFAESLKNAERSRMAKYFDTKVYERYSNQENGILAQQSQEAPDTYMLNWASYYFEILKMDSDEHVAHGELGRVVVTDLFNYSMPMIRYDTGDMAVYEEDGAGYPFLSTIQGRRMDTVYDTNGKMVSPHYFYMVLDFGEISQFQFVQVGDKSYVFRLNAKKEKVQEDRIINYFRPYLGSGAIISFEYVEEIPLLSSGKRKKIVNENKKG